MTGGAIRRAPAMTSEERATDREQRDSTTTRGQDKSRQCAARSGCCFSRVFSSFRHCVPAPRNVRIETKHLLTLRFLHIAEAGDGA